MQNITQCRQVTSNLRIYNTRPRYITTLPILSYLFHRERLGFRAVIYVLTYITTLRYRRNVHVLLSLQTEGTSNKENQKLNSRLMDTEVVH